MSRSRTPWNQRESAEGNARRQLPRMMAEYFAEVREALGDKHSPAALHRVRLASKKVRYTLELFRQCYDAAQFDARLKALKDVQTSLGEVNDAVATWRLLAKVMPHSPRRQALREYLKKRAADKAEEFRAHWTEEFDAPGQERWWTDFLGGRDGTRDGAQRPANDATAVRGHRAGRRPSRKAGA
jgi:CHAD domain-containing protein